MVFVWARENANCCCCWVHPLCWTLAAVVLHAEFGKTTRFTRICSSWLWGMSTKTIKSKYPSNHCADDEVIPVAVAQDPPMWLHMSSWHPEQLCLGKGGKPSGESYAVLGATSELGWCILSSHRVGVLPVNYFINSLYLQIVGLMWCEPQGPPAARAVFWRSHADPYLPSLSQQFLK